MRTINYTAPEPKLFVEYQGQRMALRDVAKLVGIEVRTLRSRYRAGERGERLWRPLDFEQHNVARPKTKTISEREQKRQQVLARIRAAHAGGDREAADRCAARVER